MKRRNFLRFSFKKFVAVGLSCMMFLQCSSLSFAGENDRIKTYEDSNVRICSGLEDCGYVVCTFDKKTKKLEQKITDPKTGALLSLNTFDLSKKYTTSLDRSQTKLGQRRNTWSGYKYWTDTDPKINMIYCEIHGGNNKGVYLDIGSKESIKTAYEFADIVEDIGDEETAIAVEVGLDIIASLFWGCGGALVKELTLVKVKVHLYLEFQISIDCY